MCAASVGVRVHLDVVFCTFALLPPTAALAANKNQVEALLGDLGEADCFIVLAMLAFNITAARQCRVFDTLRVHLQVLSPSAVISLVNTIFEFTPFLSTLVPFAKFALEL